MNTSSDELVNSANLGELDEERHLSLCETLDRVLNTGVVVAGDVVISVADIDLIYLNLQLMLCSVETAHKLHNTAPTVPEEFARL